MKKYLAELIGTFVLVFGGLGTALFEGDKVGILGIGLAFGFSLLAMAYTIGPISGCHINPAVTLGLLVAGKIPGKEVVGYIVGQVLGAILAAALLLFILKDGPGGYDPSATGFASNGYSEHSPGNYGLGACFVTEVILTGLLVFVVLGVTDVKAPVGFAGIPIGLVLVVIHYVGIPITNLSANPARSIGPALFAGGWAISQLWLFIVAPIIGGIAAALLFKSIGTVAPLITTQKAERALPSEQSERQL